MLQIYIYIYIYIYTYILPQIDRSGNETHLIINTTKNIIKSKLEYIMIPSDFYFFFRTFRFSIQN